MTETPQNGASSQPVDAANPPALLYVHGWESSPFSAKGRLLKDYAQTHGVLFHAFDFRDSLHGMCTLEEMSSVIAEYFSKATRRFLAVGSSVGAAVIIRAFSLSETSFCEKAVLITCPLSIQSSLERAGVQPSLIDRFLAGGPALHRLIQQFTLPTILVRAREDELITDAEIMDLVAGLPHATLLVRDGRHADDLDFETVRTAIALQATGQHGQPVCNIHKRPADSLEPNELRQILDLLHAGYGDAYYGDSIHRTRLRVPGTIVITARQPEVGLVGAGYIRADGKWEALAVAPKHRKFGIATQMLWSYLNGPQQFAELRHDDTATSDLFMRAGFREVSLQSERRDILKHLRLASTAPELLDRGYRRTSIREGTPVERLLMVRRLD